MLQFDKKNSTLPGINSLGSLNLKSMYSRYAYSLHTVCVVIHCLYFDRNDMFTAYFDLNRLKIKSIT